MKKKLFLVCIIAVCFAALITSCGGSSSNGSGVKWETLSANGSADTVTTTELTLTFNKEPLGLTVDNITLSEGFTKGALTGSDTTWKLGVTRTDTAIAQGSSVTVTLTDPAGIKISPKTKNVEVNVRTGEQPAIPITWSNLTANGTADTVTTTALTLTFSANPIGLTASNVTVTGATKGELTGSGTTRTLAITVPDDAEQGAEVTVTLSNPNGVAISPASRTVQVNVSAIPPTPVVWEDLTANGTADTVTTTELTLTFDVDPEGLTASNITVSGGVTKGALTGTGTTRTLAISNIMVEQGATITLTLTNPTGIRITPLSKTVAINVKPVVIQNGVELEPGEARVMFSGQLGDNRTFIIDPPIDTSQFESFSVKIQHYNASGTPINSGWGQGWWQWIMEDDEGNTSTHGTMNGNTTFYNLGMEQGTWYEALQGGPRSERIPMVMYNKGNVTGIRIWNVDTAPAASVDILEVKFFDGPPVPVTITFDENEGDTQADPTTMSTYAGLALLSLPAPPTRDGYKFSGWNTEDDGSGDIFMASTVIDESKTVYAQWMVPVEAEPIVVDFTEVTLIPHNATVTNVTASSYQMNSNNWGAFVKFSITLPDGVTLADYDTVSFTIEAVSGETDNKEGGFVAGKPLPASSGWAVLPNQYLVTETPAGGFFTSGTRDYTCTIDKGKTKDLSGTIEVGINIHANGSVYKISNLVIAQLEE